MKAGEKAAVLPTSQEGAAILTLWASGIFDTEDIARLLHLAESDVSRVVSWGRALKGRANDPAGAA